MARDILPEIKAMFLSDPERPPSCSEIASALGTSPNKVVSSLRELVSCGFLRKLNRFGRPYVLAEMAPCARHQAALFADCSPEGVVPTVGVFEIPDVSALFAVTSGQETMLFSRSAPHTEGSIAFLILADGSATIDLLPAPEGSTVEGIALYRFESLLAPATPPPAH